MFALLNYSSVAADDGSTGMEVAIKMALRLWDIRVKKGLIKGYKMSSDIADEEDLNEEIMQNVIVLTQKDCYHGNTRYRLVVKRLCVLQRNVDSYCTRVKAECVIAINY
jgi:hypothetical protein